jgi:hypothetical protein
LVKSAIRKRTRVNRITRSDHGSKWFLAFMLPPPAC